MYPRRTIKYTSQKTVKFFNRELLTSLLSHTTRASIIHNFISNMKLMSIGKQNCQKKAYGMFIDRIQQMIYMLIR